LESVAKQLQKSCFVKPKYQFSVDLGICGFSTPCFMGAFETHFDL